MNFDTPQPYRYRDPGAPPNSPALQVIFRQESDLNAEATKTAGKQTYDNVLIAYVSPMGNAKSDVAHEIERTLPDGTVKVNLRYASKYADQIKHYKAGTDAEALGTPLKDLIGMTPAMAMNLRARGLHNIEMLAEAADNVSQDVMGFWEWRDKARKHLELREKNAPTVRLEAELAERDATIASMQRQLDELAKALAGADTTERKAKKAA